MVNNDINQLRLNGTILLLCATPESQKAEFNTYGITSMQALG